MVTSAEFKAPYSNLKVIMLKKGVTQVGLTKELEMDRTTFNLKLNRTNGRDFTLEEAKKISESLEVSIDDFF